ncbi:MAG TPA: nucleotidyltransferase, partial [Acidimicrobiales bacterium]
PEVPDRPAMAPGSNFLEATSADSPATDELFEVVLADTVQVLDGENVPYVFMGGIGAATHGRPRWTHDIDVFVRPEDAGRVLRALAAAGFRTEQTYPDWLYKAYKHDILVDVIFKSLGGILLDDEMLERASREQFMGLEVCVMAPEDLLVVKAVVHDEHMPRHWHDALAIISRCDLDWDYVVRRARRHGARRVLSLMLYAQSNDLVVPASPIRDLFDAVFA